MNINEEIFENVFEIQMNMNDVFFFACGHSSEISARDFLKLASFYDEYGYDLFVAYEGLGLGCDPENPRFKKPRYFKAKLFLEEKIKTDTEFCKDLQRKLKSIKKENE